MIRIVAVDKCDGCETCVSNCLLAVLQIEDAKVKIVHRDMCTDCGICLEVCPKGVLEKGNV